MLPTTASWADARGKLTPMAFVFYDIETSGISQHFDQILQFAAILTDDDLQEVERFEIRSRLQPHVVPSPMALHVTGMSIEDILDPGRPSNYEMITAIRKAIGAWGPATFLGYNSLRFDEEFLRHAFYQNLHPPYLTNTGGSRRTDALNIVRAVASLRPGLIAVPETEGGKATFKLDRLAPANGFAHLNAHDALADVEATIHICRIIRDGAPDLWDAFLRFSSKAAVQEFVRSEDAFVFFEFFGNRHAANLVTPIGGSVQQPNVIYCLDLTCDLEALRSLSPEDLSARLTRSPKPVRRLKVNGSPLLSTLGDAPQELLQSRTIADLEALAQDVRADQAFVDRLIAASEPEPGQFEPSPHVEQQLYQDGFWSNSDGRLMALFHESGWEERATIVGAFEDQRLRRLARRILYFERPELLSESARTAMAEEISRRRLGVSEVVGNWLTVPKAITDLESLLSKLSEAEGEKFGSLRDFLSDALPPESR
jgi:exodeoxyribonuclease I